MSKIEIYTKFYCPFCTRAKFLLDQMWLNYTEYEVAFNQIKEREMVARSNQTTVPQIFINGQSIGGHDDLIKLIDNGEFNSLLERRNLSTSLSTHLPLEEIKHAT